MKIHFLAKLKQQAATLTLVSILLATSMLAQDDAAVAKALAACGPVNIRFDVTVDENQHPVGQPEPGKAMVYILQDGELPCILCSTTTRVGVDGTWVGANDDNSYFYFPVTPGEHHLCTDQQTKYQDNRIAALGLFTAEPGKSYYFRVRVRGRVTRDREHLWTLELEPVNSDEGQLLVASSRFSTWRLKK